MHYYLSVVALGPDWHFFSIGLEYDQFANLNCESFVDWNKIKALSFHCFLLFAFSYFTFPRHDRPTISLHVPCGAYWRWRRWPRKMSWPWVDAVKKVRCMWLLNWYGRLLSKYCCLRLLQEARATQEIREKKEVTRQYVTTKQWGEEKKPLPSIGYLHLFSLTSSSICVWTCPLLGNANPKSR